MVHCGRVGPALIAETLVCRQELSEGNINEESGCDKKNKVVPEEVMPSKTPQERNSQMCS